MDALPGRRNDRVRASTSRQIEFVASLPLGSQRLTPEWLSIADGSLSVRRISNQKRMIPDNGFFQPRGLIQPSIAKRGFRMTMGSCIHNITPWTLT